jgi:hypothetical protein
VAHKKETRGRPKLPKGEAKSEMVRARVTPSEYRAIAAKAGKEGVSEWARRALLNAVEA